MTPSLESPRLIISKILPCLPLWDFLYFFFWLNDSKANPSSPIISCVDPGVHDCKRDRKSSSITNPFLYLKDWGDLGFGNPPGF